MAQTEEKQPSPQHPDHITSAIVYNNDTGKRFHIEMPNDNGGGKFIMSTNSIETEVVNGRQNGCMLSSHGFQLIAQETALSTSDFYENPEDIIKETYYGEMEDAVKAMTGAAFVKAFHHQVRSGGTAPKGATESVDAPAHAAHNDYTPYAGFKTHALFKNQCPKDDGLDYSQGRICMINVWRNISDDAVIQNDHLAVCDGRSVVAPDDFLKYDYISPEGHKSESFYLNAARQPFHKWYYFPGMHKNELLVFMQFDSDWQNPSRHTFHTAIKDPTASAQAPPRQSIECRLIAFFPKHSPNTIPKAQEVLKGQALVDVAVKGLFDALKVPKLWPKKYARDFAKNLRSKEIGAVIKEFVAGSAAGGFHHLGGTAEEDQELVIAAMMERAAEWKQLGMDNFPIDHADGAEEDAKESGSGGSSFVDVDTAVTAMRQSVKAEVVQYWPADAKKGIATMLREQDFGEVVRSIVKGSVDGAHNALGGATEDQAKAVVDALMADGDAMKEEMMKNFPESG